MCCCCCCCCWGACFLEAEREKPHLCIYDVVFSGYYFVYIGCGGWDGALGGGGDGVRQGRQGRVCIYSQLEYISLISIFGFENLHCPSQPLHGSRSMPQPKALFGTGAIMDFFPSTLYLDLDSIQTPVHRFPTSKDSFVERTALSSWLNNTIAAMKTRPVEEHEAVKQ